MFLPTMPSAEVLELLDPSTHPAPKHHMNQALSGIMGSISIAFWIIVFTPQIYECWVRKSSDGLSLAFVVLWLAGDVFNVAGALLQHVLPTMTILAVYYTLADLVLLIECLAFKDNAAPEREPLVPQDTVKTRKNNALRYAGYVVCVAAFGFIGYLLSAKAPEDAPSDDQPLSFWGQVNGWICAILYLASRLPQIMLNYKRKSTDGISLLFFMFAVFGNITYVISIFAAGMSVHQLILNASWLAGSLGTLVLDFVIFYQFTVYG